jgi:hypothetical protein
MLVRTFFPLVLLKKKKVSAYRKEVTKRLPLPPNGYHTPTISWVAIWIEAKGKGNGRKKRNVKILEEEPERWKMNHPGILMRFFVFKRVCPMWI